MTAITVATLGDNCIDRYLPLRQSTVGGNAVNVAVHLARMGLGAAYYGAVGDDADGRRVLAALRENGVSTAGVHVRPGRTAYTDIDIGQGGERIIAFEEFGVCAGYRPNPSELEQLARMRHVHIGWLDDGGAAKAKLASSGAGISQDLSVSSPSAGRRAGGLTIAFASAGPSLAEGEAMAARLLAEGAGTVAVTCGAAGSVASDGRLVARMNARPVDVVDTLGAGDTFIAGFITARLDGRELEACLESGRDLAAATCGHLGGFPQAAGMLT